MEARNICFDYIFQHQNNGRIWSYSTDIFEQLVCNGYIQNETINMCLQVGRFTGRYPFFSFDISLQACDAVDQTLKNGRIVNRILVQQKYERNADEYLISSCDSQLLVSFTKLVTCYHFQNKLDYFLPRGDWYKVFSFQKSALIEKSIQLNRDEALIVFQSYMNELVKQLPFEVAAGYFSECFEQPEKRDDIEQTQLQISFLDPITQCQIRNPARSTRCHHVQPLDNGTFLLNKPCPLCSQPVSEIL